MSPVVRISGALTLSFPRVSGDEPADAIAKIARKTFSPRERG